MTSTSRFIPGEVTALVGDNGAGSRRWSSASPASTRSTPAIPLRGQAGLRRTARATPPPSASRSSTRTSPCATTSTSSRTCSSVASAAAGSCSTRHDGAAARETLASLSVRTVKSVRQRVSSLSGGQRQTVAIAKAVLWNSKVVILDEPTAALGRGADPPGARPGPPAGRQRPRRGADLAQHGRRLRGRRPDRRAVPRASGRRGRATTSTSTRSSS